MESTDLLVGRAVGQISQLRISLFLDKEAFLLGAGDMHPAIALVGALNSGAHLT